MHIAMFTNTFAPIVGGTETSVATFAEDLRSLGHEVLVITFQVESEPNTPGIFRISPPRSGSGAPFSSPAGLEEALDAFRPDIIHAHHPFLIGDSAFRQARSRELPLVLSHHTLYDRPEDREALADLADLESRVRLLAIDYSNHCDAVVAPTQSVAEILLAQGVAISIDIVPTGIDTARFAGGDGPNFRKRRGIPSDAFMVGHLGRLVPAKNVAFLAKATAEFLQRNASAWALFSGEGPSVAEIHETLLRAGVAERTDFLGVIPPDEIADTYAAMDLFTFASLSDTQGLVLLEAMAAGTPVLALRTTGPQDLVDDGKSGRLLPPDSTPEDFAEAISALALGKSINDLKGGARARAHRFNRRRCADKLLVVYERARCGPRLNPRSNATSESLQQEIHSAWEAFAGQPESVRALLPTRGFPPA